MDPDLLLAHPDYNLRSTSRLSSRDDPWLSVWLPGEHRLSLAFRKLRNQRLVPRKEFYETVFVLDRLQDWLRAAPPVLYDLGAGHGMAGMFAALLEPARVRRVVTVDRREPKSHARLRELLALDAPWVKERTRFLQMRLAHLPPLRPDSWALAVHCCGQLTDGVAKAAARSSIPFVVVPCCESKGCLATPAAGRPGRSVADRVNEARVERWQSWGYRVEERSLPSQVTARSRMFLCRPAARGDQPLGGRGAVAGRTLGR